MPYNYLASLCWSVSVTFLCRLHSFLLNLSCLSIIQWSIFFMCHLQWDLMVEHSCCTCTRHRLLTYVLYKLTTSVGTPDSQRTFSCTWRSYQVDYNIHFCVCDAHTMLPNNTGACSGSPNQQVHVQCDSIYMSYVVLLQGSCLLFSYIIQIMVKSVWHTASQFCLLTLIHTGLQKNYIN